MKRIVLLAMVVAFVFFSGKAALAGVFGNDNLELDPYQEIIVRAALGKQGGEVLIRTGHKLPHLLPAPALAVQTQSLPAPATVQIKPEAKVIPLSTAKPAALSLAVTGQVNKTQTPTSERQLKKYKMKMPSKDREVWGVVYEYGNISHGYLDYSGNPPADAKTLEYQYPQERR